MKAGVCMYSVNESMHVKESVVVEFLLTFKSRHISQELFAKGCMFQLRSFLVFFLNDINTQAKNPRILTPDPFICSGSK